MNKINITLMLILSLAFGTLQFCHAHKSQENRITLSDRRHNEKMELRDKMEDLGREMDQNILAIDSEFANANPDRRKKLAERKIHFENARTNLNLKLLRLNDAIEKDWKEFKDGMDRHLDSLINDLNLN